MGLSYPPLPALPPCSPPCCLPHPSFAPPLTPPPRAKLGHMVVTTTGCSRRGPAAADPAVAQLGLPAWAEFRFPMTSPLKSPIGGVVWSIHLARGSTAASTAAGGTIWRDANPRTAPPCRRRPTTDGHGCVTGETTPTGDVSGKPTEGSARRGAVVRCACRLLHIVVGTSATIPPPAPAPSTSE